MPRALSAGAAAAAGHLRRPRAASAGHLHRQQQQTELQLRWRHQKSERRAQGRGAPGRGASRRARRPAFDLYYVCFEREEREGRKEVKGVRLRPRSLAAPPNCLLARSRPLFFFCFPSQKHGRLLALSVLSFPLFLLSSPFSLFDRKKDHDKRRVARGKVRPSFYRVLVWKERQLSSSHLLLLLLLPCRRPLARRRRRLLCCLFFCVLFRFVGSRE